ncbi:MAG: Mrp/NBP35 family ATP-binding protein [Muribaculaceae bacterium]|nr:Mrp/NBP35 family ATP-binding protein [Muribaculaceae bacterium]
MQLYPKLITDTLTLVRYPGSGKNIVELNMVADDIRINGNNVTFTIVFERDTDPFIKSVTASAAATLKAKLGAEATINVGYAARPHAGQQADEAPVLPGVKNIIGVSSGKGGVGKSTVAVNLAMALAQLGHKVGLLDADIFGPSVPKMMGVEDEQLYMRRDEATGRNIILPIEKHGVKLLSIGFVVDKEKAVLWRGAMASNALRQLITEADWGELDYFIIDMPPGTSDIHLTLVQTLAMTGAVVVTTPQDVALADARKGVNMFLGEQVNVPVLGIVENMSWFTPAAHPDEQYFIFGRDGGRNLADALGVELLAQVPLVASICRGGDDGVPVVLQNSVSGQAFYNLARAVVDAVDRRNATLPPTKKVRTH